MLAHPPVMAEDVAAQLLPTIGIAARTYGQHNAR
jgi:hypothetical protein